MKLKWTPKALKLLSSFDNDFNIEGCEDWIIRNVFHVGDGSVLAYLYENFKDSKVTKTDEDIDNIKKIIDGTQ